MDKLLKSFNTYGTNPDANFKLILDVIKKINSIFDSQSIRIQKNKNPQLNQSSRQTYLAENQTILNVNGLLELLENIVNCTKNVDFNTKSKIHFLEFINLLSNLFKYFHDFELYTWKNVSSDFDYKLNSIINNFMMEILNFWLMIKNSEIKFFNERIENWEKVNIFNNLSQLFGYVLLGNLHRFHNEVLTKISLELLQIINISDPKDLLLFNQTFTTLSHLVFQHSVWESHDYNSKYNGKEYFKFISQPNIFSSFKNAFSTGLKYMDLNILSTNTQSNIETKAHRLIQQACLNGLSQLMLIRTHKLDTKEVIDLVKILWPNIVLLSRPYDPSRQNSYDQNKLDSLSGSGSDVGYPSTHSPWSSETSSYESCLSSSSDCEFHTQSSKSNPNTVNIVSDNSSKSLLSKSMTNRSKQDDHKSDYKELNLNHSINTTQNIAKYMLNNSFSCADYSTKFYGNYLHSNQFSQNKPIITTCNTISAPSYEYGKHKLFHSTQFKRQWKYYALGVFCLKRLLDACRAQVAVNCWPLLINSDCFQYFSWDDSISTGDLPQTPPNRMSSINPDLLTLFYKTSDSRIRQMLLEILISLLTKAGKRFSGAEDLSPHSTSFVPYSVRLAMELRQLHRRLSLALLTEKSFTIQGSLLKSLNALVLITPYQRLKPGLLTNLLSVIHELLQLCGNNHKNRSNDLRAGCLCLLGNILGKVPGPLIEVCHVLSPSFTVNSFHQTPNMETIISNSNTQVFDQNFSLDPESQSKFNPCWLVQVCLRLIHPDVTSLAWDQNPPNILSSNSVTTPIDSSSSSTNIYSPTKLSKTTNEIDAIVGKNDNSLSNFQPTPVRIQSLITLRQFIPNYVKFLLPSLPLIRKILLFCLQNTSETNSLWTYTLKFLAAFLYHINNQTNQNPKYTYLITKFQTLDLTTESSIQSTSTDLLQFTWWQTFLPSILNILTNGNENTDRSWCCRILNSIDNQTINLFTQTKDENGKSWLSVIVDALWLVFHNCDESLKAQCLRTFGTLVLREPLRYDMDFISHLLYESQQILNTTYSNAVGLEVSWTISNCLEVLIGLKENLHNLNLVDLSNKIIDSDSMWSSMIDSMSKYQLDWDKLIQSCCKLCAIPDRIAIKTIDLNLTSCDIDYSNKGLDFNEENNEKTKNPNDHRCENGAKIIGYVLRILSPGLVSKQTTIDELIRTLCQTIIIDKVNGAAKIRWNANYSSGNLFYNKLLWSELIHHLFINSNYHDQDQTNVKKNNDVQLNQTQFNDPIYSFETVKQFLEIVKYLCFTMKHDKYFKAKVYAELSLLSMFQTLMSNHKSFIPMDLFTYSIFKQFSFDNLNLEKQTEQFKTIFSNLPTIWILKSSLELLKNLLKKFNDLNLCHFITSSSPSSKLSPSQSSTIQCHDNLPINEFHSTQHLTENQYKEQSFLLSLLLFFQILNYFFKLLINTNENFNRIIKNNIIKNSDQILNELENILLTYFIDNLFKTQLFNLLMDYDKYDSINHLIYMNKILEYHQSIKLANQIENEMKLFLNLFKQFKLNILNENKYFNIKLNCLNELEIIVQHKFEFKSCEYNQQEINIETDNQQIQIQSSNFRRVYD